MPILDDKYDIKGTEILLTTHKKTKEQTKTIIHLENFKDEDYLS